MLLVTVRWSLRVTVGVVVAMLIGLGVSTPVSAGGSWFDPVNDRHERGEEVTLVGYTGGGAYGWIDDGPFFGFFMDSTEAGDIDIDGRRPALVGIDPDHPISREWPLDDSEVANLDEGALLSGPGFELTAGEIHDASIEVGADG